ncbi:ATP-binding protein [Methylocapsa polymorpha]|uniref:ATP-binding protein n=1 Tax=Methylocapsa polymorpha TaxID=3080828 RepID=A0ABZ0HM33_9HYPH|nr:ATP-binding protein [Methylocapsa sp. RX1]
MADENAPENTIDSTLVFPSAADAIGDITRSQLEHALDANRRRLRIYESLKSLNDVIGTQYGDRVLFELLQNAHDAHDADEADEAGEIAVRLIIDGPDRGMLLVANKGRAFTESNLEAIRNIGTSDKEIGEGIGNKGLGFRSVEALTDDVQIYSAGRTRHTPRFEGYCFRFATIDEITAELKLLGASDPVAVRVAANIPRYLIPITVDHQSDEICRLSEEGYATVVALPLASVAAIDLARKQVSAVLESPAPVLLFLDRLSALDVAVSTTGEPTDRKRLTRRVTAIASELPAGMRMERIVLDGQADYLVVRRVLPKTAVLDAVRASVTAAPPLKRWLAWKGDAVVSVAVPLNAPMLAAPRLFNFLPMDDRAVSPMAGHIDAPFFADIDRRSIKPDLPLNKYLLEAAARTAAQSALAIVDGEMALPENSVIDLAAWSGPHMPKIVEAFAALNRQLAKAEIWPVVSGGPTKWESFSHLYAWPDVRTHQLTPSKLAAVAEAAIVPASIGEGRLTRLRALAAAVHLPLSPTEDTLCRWVEAITEQIASRRQTPRRWRDFYDDVVTLYAATKLRLSSLEGKKLFLDPDDKLLMATAKGLEGAPPVFHRIGRERGKRNEGPPSPPSSLSRKFRFVSATVEISETSLRALEKAGLLRRYDPLEALNSLKGALGDTATETQRREALIWAYKVWRNTGGKAVEDSLRAAALFVPCLAGWTAASQSSFSASWSQPGRTLELFLHEAAPVSLDANDQKGRLLISFADWPRAASDDRREDWLRFLGVIGVRDGLYPIAGAVRRKGTPSNHWNSFLFSGQAKEGLDANWAVHGRKVSLSYPQTDYNLTGEVWRLPGQIEHAALPVSAKEALSELIVSYLREHGDAHFTFSIEHWRGFQKVDLPTPLQVFLREAPWPASLRRDETLFEVPRSSWSTTVGRQIPPRFVPRFWAEPGSRATLPPILFEERIALRDWAAPASAPARLASLGAALADMSAAERRDLREQLRRAWNDVAEHRLELPKGLELVVERAGGLEVLAANAWTPPVVHITTERQGFAARALADRGEAVLDIGEIDGTIVHALLAATGGFTPRLADSGDVQLQVDGTRFEPDLADLNLVAGHLSWLSDVAILAHEYLGDALELRNLPTDELDRRIRQIKLRRCARFALLIDDQEITAHGNDRVQAAPHARLPTLLVTGSEPLDVDMLLEAAPAITKLIGARRNTLEPMLGRLRRDGYSDASLAPSEDMLARAIHRDIGVVRDHFAATRGGIERRVGALLPIVAFLRDRALADSLAELHDRLGQALKLRSWLSQEFGPKIADHALTAIDDTDDQALIRRRMGFDFQGYGRTLAELGYPALNSEADFRRLFGVFMAELKPGLIERVRRRFAVD